MSAETKSQANDNPLADVERIRDIIFGSQMRQYEQRFDRLTSRFEQLGKQVSDLKVSVDQQVLDQQTRSRSRHEEMQKRLVDLEQRYSEHGSQLERTVAQKTDHVQEQTRGLISELRDELLHVIHDLEENKADRHDLGDLLVEMGLRLKEQGSIADLLSQLEKAGT